jgi:hypothetical protein
MGNFVAYKNVNTDQVVLFPKENPRLEALNVWVRVDAGEVPTSVAEAYDRAAAQRRAIEASAAIRHDTTTGRALGGIAESAARNTGPAEGEASQPLPTLAVATPDSEQSLVGVLEKADPKRAVDSTSQALARKAEAEAIANPPRDGVLARAKRDHRTGATQIGPDPEEHVGPKAAAARGEVAGAPAEGAGDTASATTTEGGAAVPKPAKSAPKQDWVAYAVACGADEAEAGARTKDELVEQYGG